MRSSFEQAQFFTIFGLMNVLLSFATEIGGGGQLKQSVGFRYRRKDELVPVAYQKEGMGVQAPTFL